jgi:hypothetical protein
MGKVNHEPRVSVNKLGEYLMANASRRKKIIYDCKHPAEFIIKRYNDAEKAIADYFSSDEKSIEIILKHINKLQSKKSKTPYQLEIVKSNMSALDSFIDCTDCIDICEEQYTYKDVSEESSISTFNNLKVSVRPEILILKEKEVVGAIKLYFSKSHPISNDVGEYITTVLKHHLEEKYQLKLKPNNCMVLDVFTKLLIKAPKSHKRRLQDILASSEEIVTRWKDL